MTKNIYQYFSGKIHLKAESFLKGTLTGWFISVLAIAYKQDIFNGKDLQEAYNESSLQKHFDTIKDIFQNQEHFLDKVKALDQYAEQNSGLVDIKELLMDLLLFNFYKTNPFLDNAHFIERDEWQKIEGSIEDRGTPMIDLFFYLSLKNDEESSLEDFLENFLMINEAEFEEERERYEEIISRRTLPEQEPSLTMTEGRKLQSTPPEELPFFPIMLFFNGASTYSEKWEFIKEPEMLHPVNMSGFLALLAGHYGLNSFPHKWQWLNP